MRSSGAGTRGSRCSPIASAGTTCLSCAQSPRLGIWRHEERETGPLQGGAGVSRQERAAYFLRRRLRALGRGAEGVGQGCRKLVLPRTLVDQADELLRSFPHLLEQAFQLYVVDGSGGGVDHRLELLGTCVQPRTKL